MNVIALNYFVGISKVVGVLFGPTIVWPLLNLTLTTRIVAVRSTIDVVVVMNV